MSITLPGVVNDFLHEMMKEYGFNKSDLLETMVFFVSMPENLDSFKSQYLLGDAGEEEGEEDEEDEEEDENEDDDEEEDEDDEPGFWARLFGSNDEEEDEEGEE